MINLIILMAIHWLSDFVCQTHEMSIKKSKSILWLTYHVTVYSAVTSILWLTFFGLGPDVKIIATFIPVFLITFGTHWVSDYFTSKWTSRLWAEEKVHEFFVVIGLDQLIHATTLLITFNYLIKAL